MNSEIKYSQNFNKETFLEEIEAVLPKSEFEKSFNKAVESIKKTATAPGFRKGNVPENVVMQKYAKEISDKSISFCIEAAVTGLDDLKPRPLEPLNIKSISDDEGSMKIVFTYIPTPEVEIADLSKIKVSKKSPKEVTEEEVNNELKNVWHHYAKQLDENAKKEDFSEEKLDAEFFEKTGIQKENPTLKTLEDLKNMIRDFIKNTYERDAQLESEKEVREEVVKKSKFEKVEAIIARELEKRVENYKSRFTQIGMDAEEYLKKNNVDLNSLKEEWRPQAELDVKFEIILQKYGEANNIQPTEEEIKNEIDSLDAATKERYGNDEKTLRSLITYYFINQKSYSEIFAKISGETK